MNVSLHACLKFAIAISIGRVSRSRKSALLFLVFSGLSFGPAIAAQSDRQNVVVGQALRGHFVQIRQLAGFDRPLRSEGSFALVPGMGLIWRGEQPFVNTTVITPLGILQLANDQVAMHLQASRIPGLSHLYEVLGAAVSGNIKPLQQTFSVTQSSGTDPWHIVLTPLHPENPAMAQLKSLTLTGGRFVNVVEIDKGGGDVDRITFLDQHVAAANLSTDEKALLDGSRQ